MRVLLSWVGAADIQGARAGELGPIARAIQARSPGRVYLLSNYPEEDNDAVAGEVFSRYGLQPELVQHDLGGDPTDYRAITAVVEPVLQELSGDRGLELEIGLASGTPAMHAIWVLLCSTKYPATLLKSSLERGVEVAVVPFEISAEWIPEVLRRVDSRIEALWSEVEGTQAAFSRIVGQSPKIRAARSRAARAAVSNFPVLLVGESGTGKELFARAIHDLSDRNKNDFVPVNCGALPRELAESLLFGHEKGAFTGASARHVGHFAQADGGSLFLDEVGELPIDLQAKLLRVLQEGSVQPVGSTARVPVNVRVLAASNRDLITEIREGRFRTDLYHRIAVLVIDVPPLRERKGDLSLLIDHLVARVAETGGLSDDERPVITPAARELLMRKPWPGNVRQLQNLLARVLVWSSQSRIDVDDVKRELWDHDYSGVDPVMNRSLGDGFDIEVLLAEVRGHYIDRAMREAGGVLRGAADLLGVRNYQTLSNWLDRYSAFIDYER